MKERLFRFKQFSVEHSKSAMKVGVDGVLIGAWASLCEGRILDVGCGCGVITLMMAQRNNRAAVVGLDIHTDSVEEAKSNVERSPWGDRVEIVSSDFSDYIEKMERELNNNKDCLPFDLIISNPPFFNAGVTSPLTPREQARHQGKLTPEMILTLGKTILSDEGRIAMIVPESEGDVLKKIAERNDMVTVRECHVKDNPSTPFKRVMLEFRIDEGVVASNTNVGDDTQSLRMNISAPGNEIEKLVMFDENRIPTQEYRELCRDFYLKF